MSKKDAVSPRKSPKQSRSRTLVEAAVEAAARVLSRFGYDDASTNRVAEAAGISIGSLYQYFPNKDALMAAVIDRQLENYKQKLEEEFARIPDLAPVQAVEIVIRHLVSTYMGNRKLLGVIFEQLPRTQRTKNILYARRHGMQLVKDAFQKHRLNIRNIDHASYIIVNGVMGVLLTAIIDDELPMTDEELAGELIDMVRGYLLWDRKSELGVTVRPPGQI